MDIFADSFDYFMSMGPERFIRFFWLFFLFDLPRYFLSDIYIFFVYVFDKIIRRKTSEELVWERKLKESPPLVSVVIPILNEEDTIWWTIRSLLEQTYTNLEIIVVDDGSTDGTPHICRKLADRYDIQYHRFDNRAGKSAALNYGINHARGDYIVFVDSDSSFDRDAVFKIMIPFGEQDVGAVAGNLMPRNADANLLTSLQTIEYIFTISTAKRFSAHLGVLRTISGAFGCFRKDVLEITGMHEPGPGNDSDLTIRARKSGFKIRFAADAICLTNAPEKMAQLIKQRWRWDRNLVKNRIRKHVDIFNPFHKNFRLSNAIASLDAIFFHVVLAAVTLSYIVYLCVWYPKMLPFILLVNWMLYATVEACQVITGVMMLERPEYLRLLAYVPLFNPYKISLKFFRLIGYAQELFFRYSLRDPFAPEKVRRRMIRW